ncbi:phosphate ABC superfamily ATP binding cassette transporter, membrane protein [Secundilactobacillus odoratitofui DSM 19909 = JCM 15043]|uniref:Phosphate transport system permease protein PstA n=1 Tax=Secundilactobacillus odoratitofui DSM 19909 = JCM 15043 TaxID=1423776 RepID=A0A0R1LZE1_9LACO|nr:phosphate ABC transporter permease PstA [Secundilactobacillus odoratitofui]KRK98995.1 phosphate ABC superfamily ATP binding cassette transporter, membrane protein [Secundilactobacillus odoratitofui DSM 19909 = JCM 15043]
MTPHQTDRVATQIINLLVAVVVLILLFLLGDIIISGLPHISWHFLTSPSSSFSAGGGIRDQLFNSLYLLVLTLVISFPLALGAAIYLSEYAGNNWFTGLIRTAIEVLSSLPSVVVGLFGYLLFVISFHLGFSILSGAIALTFFNLPLLVRSIEGSLHAVPDSQREAGIALGLSNWRTIRGIILPAALPGILTGIILSAGRVFGEAAALIYTAGQSAPIVDYTNWNPVDSNSFLNPMRPAETLAVHIWKVNTEGVTPDAVSISAGASAVLIIVILIFNFGARAIGNHLYKNMTGGK